MSQQSRQGANVSSSFWTRYRLAEEEHPPSWKTGRKQGHKCCGFCCDVRRAVIIVNGLNIAVTLLLLLNWKSSLTLLCKTDSLTFQKVLGCELVTLVLIVLARCVSSLLGIIGAIEYKTWMVNLCCGFYVLEALASTVRWNVPGMILPMLLAYPHFIFVEEVDAEIMKADTYENREKHSCCCV